MELVFEIGDLACPRGHALVYFRAPDERLYATYVIVPPLEVELGKYLPPLFAAYMPQSSTAEATAIPWPPLPEAVESRAQLERLARLRGDDLVYGGPVETAQPDRLLYAAVTSAQAYAEHYRAYAARELAAPEPAAVLPELDPEEVLLELMSDRDRLAELARRTGQLRYAVEGGDRRGIEEAVKAMERIGRYLGAKYRVAELIAAASQPGPAGQRLADLYLQRAYKLVAEDFDALVALDAAIAAEQGGGS
jgi:hypothetical protein